MGFCCFLLLWVVSCYFGCFPAILGVSGILVLLLVFVCLLLVFCGACCLSASFVGGCCNAEPWCLGSCLRVLGFVFNGVLILRCLVCMVCGGFAISW